MLLSLNLSPSSVATSTTRLVQSPVLTTSIEETVTNKIEDKTNSYDKVSLSAASLKKLEAALKKIEEQEKLRTLVREMREQEKNRATEERQRRKSLALERVGELKLRLEMLQKLVINLPPGAAKAIAAQLKQIAQELRQAVQNYADAGSGQSANGTTVNVQVNLPAAADSQSSNVSQAVQTNADSVEKTVAANAEQEVEKAETTPVNQATTPENIESKQKTDNAENRTEATKQNEQNPDAILDQAFRQLVAEVAQKIRSLALLLKNQLKQKERDELAEELKQAFRDIHELLKKIDQPNHESTINLNTSQAATMNEAPVNEMAAASATEGNEGSNISVDSASNEVASPVGESAVAIE